MPEYTVLAVVAVALTVVLERWSGTRLFARAQFWVAMAIVVAFQVLVDGWLTKLSAPIVRYAPGQYLGVRWPWDVPVEDYLFGFAMVGSAIILWEWAKRRTATEAAGHLARGHDDVGDGG
ncbi:MAG TPA: lycopene cyclase domain-containing protein [Intrasporangium sp.]|nr:lycopene cyclase domain-containing protein [Intrasporangium sp.]